MMEFNYVAIDRDGTERRGTLRAENWRGALDELERLGYSVVSLQHPGRSSILSDLHNFSEADSSHGTLGLDGHALLPEEVAAEDRELAMHWPAIVAQAQSLVPVLNAYAAESPYFWTRRKARRLAQQWQLLNVKDPRAGRERAISNWIPTLLADRAIPGEHVALQRMSREFAPRSPVEPLTRLWGSLVYAAILMIGALAILVFLSAMVFPVFANFFTGVGVELPVITSLLLQIAALLQSVEFWFGTLVIVASLFGIWAYLKWNKGGTLLAKVGRSRRGTREQGWSQWAEDVRQLLRASLPVSSAVRFAGLASPSLAVRTTSQHWIRRCCAEPSEQPGEPTERSAAEPGSGADAGSGAEAGAPRVPQRDPSDGAVRWGAVPVLPAPVELALRHYAVEADGGELLKVVAEAYGDRHLRRWSAWVALVPPFTTLLIGLFVGVVVLALFLPLVSLISSLT